VVHLCAQKPQDCDGLTVGVGIATGSVIQGMIGSIRRADYTVIGDSVNLASRLCGIARGMQVLVSDATRSEADARFRFRGPYSVRLKGKADAQRVWILAGGPGGTRS